MVRISIFNSWIFLSFLAGCSIEVSNTIINGSRGLGLIAFCLIMLLYYKIKEGKNGTNT